MHPTLLALAALAAPLTIACAAHAPLQAPMAPIMNEAPAPAPLLVENHFKRDVMGDVTEAQLREILASPVYLEPDARIGVVPVATGYALDEDIPIGTPPGLLREALASSGYFTSVTEVSTDWPTGMNIGGLRERAARYRVEYLLMYRHRFVDRSYTNGWGAMWLTIIGGLFVPSRTIDVAGVVEATCLDVKTGTLLFTSLERVSGHSQENIWQDARKRRVLKQKLLDGALKTLTGRVLEHFQFLIAARPTPPAPPIDSASRPAELQAPTP
jgi:hypothetical protein